MPDYSNEARRIEAHNRRAIAWGKPGTLTLKEWVATLDYFEWSCAYCGGAFSVLEHVEPVEAVGTTRGNCLPACVPCNSRKSNHSVSSLQWLEYANRAFEYWRLLNSADCPAVESQVEELVKFYCYLQPATIAAIDSERGELTRGEFFMLVWANWKIDQSNVIPPPRGARGETEETR